MAKKTKTRRQAKKTTRTIRVTKKTVRKAKKSDPFYAHGDGNWFFDFLSPWFKLWDKAWDGFAAYWKKDFYFRWFYAPFAFAVICSLFVWSLKNHDSAFFSKMNFKTSFNSSLFNENKGKSMSDRLSYWSHWIQERQYEKNWNQPIKSELGKKPSIQDFAYTTPRKFDCTTFVEFVYSMSKSEKADDFFKNLFAIRYKNGNTTYAGRNHFPSLDWLRNNEKAGIIKDITSAVAKKAGVVAKTESKTINRHEWLSQQVKAKAVNRKIAESTFDQWNKKEDVEVTYIPVDKVESVMKSIPNGSVINLVREDDSDHPVLISHQGFVIHENGKTYFRHASVNGKIKSVLLGKYLKGQQKRSWPLLGINIVTFEKVSLNSGSRLF